MIGNHLHNTEGGGKREGEGEEGRLEGEEWRGEGKEEGQIETDFSMNVNFKVILKKQKRLLNLIHEPLSWGIVMRRQEPQVPHLSHPEN